jgi:hypothetical protein
MTCRVGCCCVGRHLELWKLCAPVAAFPRSRCKVCSCFYIANLESALFAANEQTESQTTLTLQGLSSSHLVFDRIQAWQAFSVLLRIARSPCSAFSCEARWRLSKSLESVSVRTPLSMFAEFKFHACALPREAMEAHTMVPKKHRHLAPQVENVDWTCCRRRCCTYARLKPFPQSGHLYARSLSSVLERKHNYPLKNRTSSLTGL